MEWREKIDDNFLLDVVTDLSKAIDCIPCALFIAKLAAYALKEILLKHIYC